MPLDIFPDIQKISPSRDSSCLMGNKAPHGLWPREKASLADLPLRNILRKSHSLCGDTPSFNGPLKRYGILLRE
ncbi:hypothetical protein LptCag_0483 [Leptospirillum ferriphilum]|uniref:Uncharacterized protein n=1 Tax=Leptospirillum ferriphilum TaxID=178606 RepID=A0A094W5L4_9BACT|nr:hypothetical protein LptCag_0483 [Leptospirillum ferriphilum]